MPSIMENDKLYDCSHGIQSMRNANREKSVA